MDSDPKALKELTLKKGPALAMRWETGKDGERMEPRR